LEASISRQDVWRSLRGDTDDVALETRQLDGTKATQAHEREPTMT
jgi:hypothetical protein